MKSLRILYYCLAATLLCGGLTACNSSADEADATGVFEATEVLVSAESGGRILHLDLQEGDRVESGRVVGYIDTVQLALKREQLLASMDAVGHKKMDVAKQVAATRRQIEQAEREYARSRDLLHDRAGTQKQVDDAEAQVAVLRRQLEAQLSTMTSANLGVRDEQRSLELQVLQLDDQLQKCRIASPIRGTVLTKYAEAGEVTAAGRPLFKVADLEHIYLRAYVEAPQLTALRLGQEVTVYADRGEADRTPYPGRVVWISGEAEFTPKTIQTRDERSNLVYAVKIAVDNSDGQIKLGMYGSVDFTKKTSK
ncbi:HlyD family efflux transporter periplasmic adaptor subunit [Bacteroides eggerthii]|uniref:HlyD family efflux transporter periplasmic adaptor subunit n=1 Tax=Bacteroides eggerthii TaxID=28111 RepID=A0ABT7U4B8_9BACE|nr:HlyD family efflux transporter periplasmic adaptor subunit [Bacteroides eggerthii]